MNKNDVGSSTRSVDEKLDTLKDAVKGLVDQGAQKVEAGRQAIAEGRFSTQEEAEKRMAPWLDEK